MTTETLATHLDPAMIDSVRSLALSEKRTSAQILSVALKVMLDQSPGARRALIAVDDIADETERAFAVRLIGRSVLKAYEGLLDGRRSGTVHRCICCGSARVETE